MTIQMTRHVEDGVESAEPHFRGKCQTSLMFEDIDEGLKESIKKMYTSFIEFQRQGSNWTIDKMVNRTIHMARYRPLYSTAYQTKIKTCHHQHQKQGQQMFHVVSLGCFIPSATGWRAYMEIRKIMCLL
jgi:hypothetical protein